MTPLTNVTWVNSTTLTATVPWGIDPGTYDLTVVNPDGSDTMADAFTVTQGIGGGTQAISTAERSLNCS